MLQIPASILRIGILVLVITLVMPLTAVAAKDHIGKIRIAVTRYIGDAHNFIARELGLFKRHGLNAKLVINQTGLESVRQLLRQEVDFAMITPTPVIFSAFDPKFFLKGPDPDPDYVIIANLMQSSSLNSVVVRADRKITQPKDLAGKRLAMKLGTGSEYYWQAYSVYHGIDRKKVQVVDAKIKDIANLLKSGAVDGFTIWDPVTDKIRKQVTFPTLVLPEQKLYSNGRLVIVRKDFAQQHGDLVEHYLNAIYDAESILQKDFIQSTGIMAKKIGVTEAGVRYMQNKMTFNLSLDESLLFNFSEQAKWARRTKYQDHKQLPDFRKLLYANPLAAIKPGGVNFIN